MKNLIIGSHVSYKKNEGLVGSVLETLSYDANAFMFYTGAPQNTNRSPVDMEKVNEAHKLMEKNNISKENVIVHAPYIINLASSDDEKFNFAVSFLKQELKRTEDMGFDKIVLHPGSHVGIGSEAGITNIIYGLNLILKDDININICLETMAGKGTEIGRTFEELRQIIDGVNSDKVKVCLDTCHISDAGYDVTNFDAILDEFDKVIGLDKLACIHINDSKNEIGTHKDRHENIGFGYIGFDNMLNIIYNERIKNVPKILETPYISETSDSKDRTYPPYKFEIEMIKNKKFDENLFEKVRNYYK